MKTPHETLPKVLATLAAGMLFGFGLSLSSMIQPEVVLSFLHLQDFGLMLVMGGAVTVVMLVYKLAPHLLTRPLLGDHFHVHPSAWNRDTAMGSALFGLGWGFFDCNNMPILCQIARPEWRATGYGIMNLVSISCGGFGDVAFGALRDRHVPLNLIFGAFAGIALLSILILLFIQPAKDEKGLTLNADA